MLPVSELVGLVGRFQQLDPPAGVVGVVTPVPPPLSANPDPTTGPQ
ncbi:MAG: hypothetical protein HQM15_02255 [Deltaproteobacteria bacterium]|nr:hypothetical protein [Deltaproteobacteria bacterium]